jgi:ketosteroid isomerase-like protein
VDGDAPEITRESVLAALDELWRLYEDAAPEFFDAFTEDASFFSPSSPLRIEGREEYRRLFGPQLGAQPRATQVLHPQVRLLGGAALVTIHSRIRVNYSSVDQRITAVIVREGGRLKIAHLHMSPLVAPAGSEPGERVEEITVVPAAAASPDEEG